MHEFSFEKLNAWQRSRELVKMVYKITQKFPSGEKFGLINQMRRAAVSISSNLAEGTSRSSKKDQAHFSQISYGSLIEVLNQVILSLDLGFINIEDYELLRNKVEEVSNYINNLRRSQLI